MRLQKVRKIFANVQNTNRRRDVVQYNILLYYYILTKTGTKKQNQSRTRTRSFNIIILFMLYKKLNYKNNKFLD